MTALEVRGLAKSFGHQRVLESVDLRVEDSITAILGSSGCGKTTLLRLVAGFLEPDHGSISLGGRLVAGEGRPVPSRRRRVGYVPQEGALFPHLDVAANIGFGLSRAARRAHHGGRIAEMLELVELPQSVAKRFPHEISGGQQQRVALARAMAAEPAIVLLDEPFSSLDAGLREDTGRAVVRALRANGAAALLVTHDQGEALSLADEVAVMAHGRFLQVAPPATLYLSPATVEVASFVGHSALLPGDLADGVVRCELGSLSATGSAGPGPVTVAVRPEQVTIGPAGGAARDADVLDISFFGHDATVRVRLVGTDAVVSARLPADSVPIAGERVGVGVSGPVVTFVRADRS